MPAFAAAAAALALGVAACGASNESDTPPASTGERRRHAAATAAELSPATSPAPARAPRKPRRQAWIAGFQDANPDVTIAYDPVGSGGGREQFIAGGTQYGGTDSHFKDEELTKAQERCGGPDNLVEIPVYISPIAIIYNLEGVENLQLSPGDAGEDLQAGDQDLGRPGDQGRQPGRDAPERRASPSSTAPTSRARRENFQQYLAAVAPDVWTFEPGQEWPVKGGEAAQGTSGVVDAVKTGKGAIGYADASQAGELGKATIKVGEAFVGPTPEAAAKVVELSKETDDPGAHVFTYDLDRTTTEAGAYPIVLVSYAMACTKYDDAAQARAGQGLPRTT